MFLSQTIRVLNMIKQHNIMIKKTKIKEAILADIVASMIVTDAWSQNVIRIWKP